MRLKNAFKYQMASMLKAIGIYYGATLAIRIGLSLISIFIIGDQKIHMSAFESNTLVFMLFLGIFSIVEDFKFFVQNGYSRKSLMKLYLLQFLACSAILAGLDVISAIVFASFDVYESLCFQIYGTQNILMQFLWLVVVYTCVGMVSFFMTILVQRMNKVQRIVYLLLLPLALIMFLPLLDVYVWNHALSSFAWDVLLRIMGFYDGVSMMVSTFSFTIITIIFCLLSYLTIRRASVFMQS